MKKLVLLLLWLFTAINAMDQSPFNNDNDQDAEEFVLVDSSINENLPLRNGKETITLLNTTNNELFCRLYYVNARGNAQKADQSMAFSIAPQETKCFHFPKTIPHHDTQLFIATEKTQYLLLNSELTAQEISQLTVKSFRQSNWANWYLLGREYDIIADPTAKYHLHVTAHNAGLLRTVALKLVDIKTPTYLMEQLSADFKENPHLFSPQLSHEAAVFTGKADQLPKEATFCIRREPHIRAALNQLFGEEVMAPKDSTPKIALVFCGGGYRAMTETIGFLRGADDPLSGNIFDCCNYMTGLSGSTWALNPLVLSGLRPRHFSEVQKNKVTKTRAELYRALKTNYEYHRRRFIQSRYGQTHGLIGYYGHALSHSLLNDLCPRGLSAHDITLSDLQHNLDSFSELYPLPISVAIDPGAQETHRTWFECSPYYCGTHQDGSSWIETRFFGSVFHQGKLIHATPGYPLAHYMGIWGSAFALDPDDISKESVLGGGVIHAAAAANTILKMGYSLLTGTKTPVHENGERFAVATIPNYNYGNSNSPETVQKKKTINLIDGGIAKDLRTEKDDEARNNFAIIPALYRECDVIIMCDANENADKDKRSKHLLAASHEARRLGLPFPNLSQGHKGIERLRKVNEDIEKQDYALIIEDDPAHADLCPIVIYMKAKQSKSYDQWLKEDGSHPQYINGFNPSKAPFTATLNFEYTPEQFELLAGLTEHIFIKAKPAIKAGIRQAIIKKRKN